MENYNETLESLDNILPFIERQTYEANITLRIGQASYGDLFRDLESPLLKGDIVTIRYDKGAAVLKEGTTYQILIYNTSNKSEVINNSANFGEDYTFTLPYDVQAIRANITDGSKIIATGVSTGHITVSSELEKTVKNVDEIQKAQQKLSIVNCLLGRHKPVYRINEDEVYDRPQSKLCAIKSFWPKIDYRGIPVFEEMVNYTGFNPLAPIHFEEQFIFVNRMDYPYIGVSYISSNIREWKKYTHLSKFDYSLLGENQNGGNWGVSANEYGLSIFETSYYKQAGNGKIHSIFWSLDGGRSYEPAINNLRAYTSILKSELQEGSTITIDDKSITVVSAEDIYTYLSNFYNGDSSSGMSSEQLIENAKEYLSDKVIYSTNENDTLRNLAGILIDIGYKVRLRDNDLIIYYKDLGKCEMKLSIDPFKYRHMSWDYCDEHYKDNSRYWEICSNVFDEEITINGKRGIYLWEKNIVDDLSPASIINDGGRYSFRNIHTAENATSIDGQNVRYIIDLPHIPFFISETALSLAFISLDCHKQDGRFDKWKTEKNYKECFETFKDTLISPASFCKCAAEKTKAIEKYIAQIADVIDQTVAVEQAWKKIFTECLDSADKKGGVWQ